MIYEKLFLTDYEIILHAYNLLYLIKNINELQKNIVN